MAIPCNRRYDVREGSEQASCDRPLYHGRSASHHLSSPVAGYQAPVAAGYQVPAYLATPAAELLGK